MKYGYRYGSLGCRAAVSWSVMAHRRQRRCKGNSSCTFQNSFFVVQANTTAVIRMHWWCDMLAWSEFPYFELCLLTRMTSPCPSSCMIRACSLAWYFFIVVAWSWCHSKILWGCSRKPRPMRLLDLVSCCIFCCRHVTKQHSCANEES